MPNKPKMQSSSFTARNICLAITGILLSVSGLVLLLSWPWLFDFIIKSMRAIKPGSLSFQVWQKTPLPVTLDLYIFNWTNSEDIYNKSTKPKFEELGPYVFQEVIEKVNIRWNKNGTITYNQMRKWHFVREKSIGDLDVDIVLINPLAVTAAYRARDWSYVVKKGLSFSLQKFIPNKLHVKKKLREILFEGYKDFLIDIAHSLPFLADTVPKWDRFGWFYTRNGSTSFDGTFNIESGKTGDIGEMRQWNYKTSTDFFEGQCAEVHGSGGELYPPRSSRTSISFFSTDLCRNIKLDYEQDVEIKGIKGYKYSAQHSMLDNGQTLPENACYCSGECVPSGMLNVSSCRWGTPSFASLPHFYSADPYYINLVDGLAAQRDKHEMYITLEPTTGLPLDVAVRLQLNILLQPVSDIALFEDVPKFFYPALWFEQKVVIPDEYVWKLNFLLNFQSIFPILGTILLTLGAILLLFVLYKPLIHHTYKKLHFNKKALKINREEQPLNEKGIIAPIIIQRRTDTA